MPTAGVTVQNPHAAELQKEIDELSRALDTFDSKVLATIWRFHPGRSALPVIAGHGGKPNLGRHPY